MMREPPPLASGFLRAQSRGAFLASSVYLAPWLQVRATRAGKVLSVLAAVRSPY